jgi:hypothetical protein
MGCGGSKEAKTVHDEPARVVGGGVQQNQQQQQYQMTTPAAGGGGGGGTEWKSKLAHPENPVVFFDMLQGGEFEWKERDEMNEFLFLPELVDALSSLILGLL